VFSGAGHDPLGSIPDEMGQQQQRLRITTQKKVSQLWAFELLQSHGAQLTEQRDESAVKGQMFLFCGSL